MITIVLGSQWGDEGKGKLTDILCAQSQICARAAVSLTTYLS
jgi:adenylosuccinate synthase